MGTTQCCRGDGTRAWECHGAVGSCSCWAPLLQPQGSGCLCLSQGTHCALQPMAEAEGSMETSAGAGGAEELLLITERWGPAAFCPLAGTLRAGLRWLVVADATEQPQPVFSACPLV